VIFKKSDKIQFISTVDGLGSVESFMPKPAKNFIPSWFKEIDNKIERTVKRCPSFPDYFSQGYIIPMWSDVKLNANAEGDWNWKSATNKVSWDSHDNDQFLKYVNPSFNGVESQFIFKANCPWRIITPPGWSVLQLPLFYHFNQEWSVLPGVIDTDIHHEINQQVLYHGNGEEILIEAGDPFVLYIPFKRSEKLKLEIRHQTEKDKKLFDKQGFELQSTFLAKGYYRKLQRKRDKGV
jgi:hypothetical protein